MTRTYKMMAGLVLAGLFQWAGLASAQEASECKTETLKGAYSWHGSGTIPGKALAYVGVFTFDGQGTFKGTEIASFSGDIITATWTGTYSVNPDCSASIRLSAQGSTYVVEVVLSDGGKEFYGIQADPPGTVLTFEGKRQ